MFEVRCFLLGKVKGLFLGQGPFLWRFPRFQVAALGVFLPTCRRWELRTGLVRATHFPDLLRLH